jgi:hypothetical protein
MKTKGITAVALAVLLAGLASPANATTAARLSTEALARAADVIVVGRVVDQSTRWVDRNLVTLVTVAVSEVLKGDAGGRLTVALPGGVDASRRIPVAMIWPAAPVIRPRESGTTRASWSATAGTTRRRSSPSSRSATVSATRASSTHPCSRSSRRPPTARAPRCSSSPSAPAPSRTTPPRRRPGGSPRADTRLVGASSRDIRLTGSVEVAQAALLK